MAGINQLIMLALSMVVVVAGLAGAGGLGSVVTSAVTQLDVAGGFEGGLVVAVTTLTSGRDGTQPAHTIGTRNR
jgi:glycine betaine/proline transport system permease protein